MARHITLRALARLLCYPDAAVRAALPHVRAALAGDRRLDAARRAQLDGLIDALQGDPLEAEARHVQTFDFGRATSLNLFEHVHGESRDRGAAMIDLRDTYLQGGLALADGELPDYLPAVLEFASTQPPALADAFVGEFAHILNALHAALAERGSGHAAVVAAVLELTGHAVVPVSTVADEPIDGAWQEPAAFDGCSNKGQSRTASPQPVHFVRSAPRSARAPS